MKLITNLVSEYVVLALLVTLFLLWNEKKAFHLGILVIVSQWLNELAKYFFALPRPFHLDPSLGMIHENGFGFPSGHAQFSLTLTMALAYWLTAGLQSGTKKKRARFLCVLVWTAAAFISLLVSFSRLYLGVHFPWDIAGGWVLGALLFLCFLFCQSKKAAGCLTVLTNALSRRGETKALRMTLAAAALASLVMITCLPQNIIPGALFLGFTAGFAVMKRYFPFTAFFNVLCNAPEARQELMNRFRPLLIFCTGFAGALLIYLVLKAVFPGPSFPLYRFFRFVRYALLGFWISGGAPWIFRHFPALFGHHP